MVKRLLTQTKYDLLIFRRNPAAAFFTVVLPLIFLVLFVSLFGNETTGDGVKLSRFYVPGILALSVISSTFVNLAMTTTSRRETGVLKRVRGTPLPPSVFVGAQVLTAIVITFAMAALMLLISGVFFDTTISVDALPSFVIALVVGTAAFCCLGLALSTIIPSEKAAPAMTNAIVLPLYFISGTFFPVEDAPAFLKFLGNLFPVKHLTDALFHSFDPRVDPTAIPWTNLGVIGAWGALGLLIAMTRFRWMPSR